MIKFAEARKTIASECALLPPVQSTLLDANGRVLREAIFAPIPLPPFDNSQVDGFAVSLPGAESWSLVGEVPAGASLPASLSPGEAVRIFTGAPIPPGAHAVMMQEEAHLADNEVRFDSMPVAGANIRRAGEEVRTGDLALPPGHRITPASVSLLASLGLTEVPTSRRTRLTILATGSELAAPGGPLRPGEVYASNGLALNAAASALGAEASWRPVADRREDLERAFREALDRNDVVISTGGVSVGDYDLVREVLADIGVEERFWRVAIRPGKPVFFGVAGPRLVFGLPGNPVSALVTFHLFVRPALRILAGLPAEDPLRLPAGAEMHGDATRDVFYRVKIEGGQVFPLERQGSHMALGLAMADGLAHLLQGTVAPPGQLVPVIPLSWGG